MKIKNFFEIKKLFIILISFFTLLIQTGCFDSREIDDQTYVIAIGFDNGKTSKLRMTLQYAIPINIGGGGESGGGGGGEGSEMVSTLTLECPSVYSGLNMVNNFVGKQVNLSHAKVIVFSEELAKDGRAAMLAREISRGREFRPTMIIAVSECSPEEYLKSIKPKQETDPAKYYELKFRSYKYTGFTANTQLHFFNSCLGSYGIQPVATLVGVGGIEDTDDFSIENSTALSKGRTMALEGDYIAGNLPKVGDIKGEAMGLVVFNGPHLAGKLDGEETCMYLIAIGEFNNNYTTFIDPKRDDLYVVVRLSQSRKPEYDVKMVGDIPEIGLSLKLECDLLSVQSAFNYEDTEREVLEQWIEKSLTESMTRFLKRTAQEMNSDICGFGTKIKSKFATQKQWEEFEWLSRYKDARFNVKVDVKIRRPGLNIRNTQG